MTTVSFPTGFRWGTATSSYQIEGAAALDGRTPSIWDTFCQVPGAIANGEDGLTAVDHYHRYRGDVAQMAELGLDTYRFSVSWSRVIRPDGSPNPAGMDFYSRLVDELLGAGIEPWLTLYHWDLPEFLTGGWLNRDTAARFADYAQSVHAALGDRVRIWTTLNEPWCSSFLSYGAGEHAPGHTSPVEAVRAAHHLMLAHGLGTQALRAADPAAQLGLTVNFTPVSPADPSNAADVDVARRIDGTANRFFIEAILRGAYPSDVLADLGPWWEPGLVQRGDLAVISTPIDLLGVNYYTTDVVRAPRPDEVWQPPVVRGRTLASPHITASSARVVPRDLPVTDLGWPVDPDGLYQLLLRLHAEYTGAAGVGMVITENGAACPDDVVDADGTILDLDRIEYLRGHLAACGRAIAGGVDLRGYLLWSLIDNFEWAHGYDKRFGILAVDSELGRHPKASARWYQQLVRTGVVET
jgi:beta-glucosidase